MSKPYLPADPRGLRAFYFCIGAHQASVEPDAQAQTLEMVDLRIVIADLPMPVLRHVAYRTAPCAGDRENSSSMPRTSDETPQH